LNPWDLSSSDLLVWGIVLHLIADWPLQNDWMANNKMKRFDPEGTAMGSDPGWLYLHLLWIWRHPAAYVHAGIHCALLALVFGWVAIPLAVVHLIIDTRVPVVWWSSKVIKQTQPKNNILYSNSSLAENEVHEIPVYDVGMEVRFWTDQVFHITCIAVAALLVTL
jgi:hypothetical protein